MQYFETELVFNELVSREKKWPDAPKEPVHPQTDVLGIKVRIGNQPLVYSLNDLSKNKDKTQPAIFLPDAKKEYYLIVHAIGVARTQGRAKVEELQYTAEACSPVELQTIDLIPGTKFKTVIKAGATLEGALSVSGEALLNIPVELTQQLIPGLINIGGGVQLQLSASADFVGKFSFSIQLPVVQAVGIASTTCSWVLNPDEHKTPLLGDQLLIQSIAVPKGTKQITYKLSGLVKADKGLFWKQQQKSTPDYTVYVKLG